MIAPLEAPVLMVDRVSKLDKMDLWSLVEMFEIPIEMTVVSDYDDVRQRVVDFLWGVG